MNIHSRDQHVNTVKWKIFSSATRRKINVFPIQKLNLVCFSNVSIKSKMNNNEKQNNLSLFVSATVSLHQTGN